MKLFTATFQQSQAITSTRAEEIIEHIKGHTSLRRQYWYDYGGVLFFYFLTIFLIISFYVIFPRTFGALTNVLCLLVVSQAVIAVSIMLISLFYHNWIIERLFTQGLLSILRMVLLL